METLRYHRAIAAAMSAAALVIGTTIDPVWFYPAGALALSSSASALALHLLGGRA